MTANPAQPTISAPAFPGFMADLVDRAASLLRCRWVAPVAGFNAEASEWAYYVRFEWPLEQLAPLAVVRDQRSDEHVCQSLPGQPCQIETPDLVSVDRPDELMNRAADALKGRWCAKVVDFNWWADGEDTAHCARMEWPAGLLAPLVQVFDARSGAFVCQSLEGRPFEIDPHTWCLDAAPDAVAHRTPGALTRHRMRWPGTPMNSRDGSTARPEVPRP